MPVNCCPGEGRHVCHQAIGHLRRGCRLAQLFLAQAGPPPRESGIPGLFSRCIKELGAGVVGVLGDWLGLAVFGVGVTMRIPSGNAPIT